MPGAPYKIKLYDSSLILLGDISHPSDLIAKGLLNDPLDFCHIITSTTHKTLRGPRGGVIMMGKDFENPWGYMNKKGNIVNIEIDILSKYVKKYFNEKK